MSKAMKVLVLTSCTGEKSVQDEHQLTLADFQRGPEHIQAREKGLPAIRADMLYTGLQHQRLMRGVLAARQSDSVDLELLVLSAGYGLVDAELPLAPYEATFSGMRRDELLEWARKLRIASDIREVLSQTFDLTLVLLGEDYLAACELSEDLSLGGPAIFLCSAASSKKLPKLPLLSTVVVTNAEAKRFGCGLVGLKGEVAARVLERLVADPSSLQGLLHGSSEFLEFAERGVKAGPVRGARSAARANPAVDRVIELPDSWPDKPHRARLAYFIPEWDDLVDGDYDFAKDTHSGGSGDWSNEVYAHQMYPEPNYDGILISKVVAEKSKKKAERINRMGVHRFLRVPRDFPVMGDCGAFGYIKEHEPPYSTTEILDYYSRLDFDYGVSIDHFAIGEEADRKRRYQLTIHNAEQFLKEHRQQGLPWTPIGAVQGWDEKSFSEAARQYAAMGYRYIAVGAMVRRRTPEILSIVSAVRGVIPAEMKLHLFGVARLNAVDALAKAGVNSADSASVLRRAWMGTGKNYLSIDGRQFAAIRVPEAGKSFRAKRMVSEGRATSDQVERLEQACIKQLRAFDRGEVSVDSVLTVMAEYDHLITPDRPDTSALFRETLEARPWKTCPCDICRKDGIEVVIFRGNNRNRRRGFHNTYVFYQLFQRVLAGERLSWLASEDDADVNQPDLFSEDQALQEA
ncbi:MAG: tRNA-guanine transglycosylase DpdA [Rubrivivax sp.]